jgi:alkylated DNA repair dioxygenase AlkB
MIQNLLPKDGEAYYFSDFLSADACEAYFSVFVNTLLWRQEKIKLYGKEIKVPRLTAWYGDLDKTYSYSKLTLHPHPWTPELLAIKNKIEGLAGGHFTNVLLNYYRDGTDSMGWHADDEKELGPNPTIASISLGATRAFKFRHKNEQGSALKLELASGSLLLMQGETQHYWQHEVPKSKRIDAPRINLTFRRIV